MRSLKSWMLLLSVVLCLGLVLNLTTPAGATAPVDPGAREIGLARLVVLADHLDKSVPKASYRKSDWGSCSAGHATEVFAAEGFYLTPVLNSSTTGDVHYRGKTNMDAARSFFGCSDDEAVSLFGGSHADSGRPDDPKAEAAKIRRFVAERRDEAFAVALRRSMMPPDLEIASAR